MAQPRRKPQQSKQAGGTVLGVVLGLIVGLAIAVVVALYITRSPSPFVAKVQPPADNGASDAQPFDPNRALQGKTPGQPVPQTAQTTPPNTAPGQGGTTGQSGMLPAPQIVEVPPSGGNASSSDNDNDNVVPPQPADVTPAPAPQKKSQPKPQAAENTNDFDTETSRPAPQPRPQATAKAAQTPSQAAAPHATAKAQAPSQTQTQAAAPKATSPAAILANNAPPKATSPAAILANNAPPKPPTAIDANTGYFLQVGAYKTEPDAEQQRARLGFQGFESKVSKRDVSGVTYFRVRVGPFSKFEDMNSARQRLSDAGVDTAVIRFTKQ
jgi:cell division protein FtsN